MRNGTPPFAAAAIDWSYRLLTPEPGACWSGYRLFATVEPGNRQSVCAQDESLSEKECLDLILELKCHSLVMAESPREMRFRMLE